MASWLCICYQQQNSKQYCNVVLQKLAAYAKTHNSLFGHYCHAYAKKYLTDTLKNHRERLKTTDLKLPPEEMQNNYAIEFLAPLVTVKSILCGHSQNMLDSVLTILNAYITVATYLDKVLAQTNKYDDEYKVVDRLIEACQAIERMQLLHIPGFKEVLEMDIGRRNDLALQIFSDTGAIERAPSLAYSECTLTGYLQNLSQEYDSSMRLVC